MENSALYYPHISFLHPNWVKAMAMFYDRIYRIVPDDHIPDDPEELQPLLEDPAIGEMLDPIPYSKRASEKFMENIGGWSAAALTSTKDEKKELARVHIDKTDEKVKALFADLGYKQAGKWLHVPQELASNYMLFLAREIALNNRLALITHDWGAWTATSYFNLDGAIDETIISISQEMTNQSPDPFALFGLVISGIAPMNIDEIPGEDIVAFRVKRKDEIAALRSAVFNLSVELGGLEDPVVRRNVLESKIQMLSNALTDYRNSADFIKVKGWIGTALMGLPAPIALMNVFSVPHAQMVTLAATGIALGGLFNIQSTKQDLEDLRKNNPASCLFELSRSFKKYTTARGGGDINYHAFNCMEEYVND